MIRWYETCSYSCSAKREEIALVFIALFLAFLPVFANADFVIPSDYINEGSYASSSGNDIHFLIPPFLDAATSTNAGLIYIRDLITSTSTIPDPGNSACTPMPSATGIECGDVWSVNNGQHGIGSTGDSPLNFLSRYNIFTGTLNGFYTTIWDGRYFVSENGSNVYSPNITSNKFFVVNIVGGQVTSIEMPVGTKTHVIDSDITGNTTFLSNEVYRVYGNVTIDSGVTLTVQPGAIVKFDTVASSGLTVAGTLIATSTASNPIYFTSLKDDSIGGDTNGDASTTSASAGDWGNVAVVSGGKAILDNTVVRYGGAGSTENISNSGGILKLFDSLVATSSNRGISITGGYSLISSTTRVVNNTNGIYMTGGGADIKFVTVSNNANYGVYVDGATTTIDVSDIHHNLYGIYIASGSGSDIQVTSSQLHDNSYGTYANSGSAIVASNSIHNNSYYGVFSNGVGGDTTAINNYWGASDGPSGQGSGSGDAVSTHVSFSPYLAAEHYVATLYGVQISSVNLFNEIRYDGDPAPYDAEWYASIKTWNDLGNVAFATSTFFFPHDISVSTTSRSDLPFEAQWTYVIGDVDPVVLNGAFMDADSSVGKQNAITHELGHALGLGHSYPGNVMNYMVTGITTLGSQDIVDYYYLHP